MKRICVLTLLILIALSACQPTPTAPIVQSKNDGKLEDAINAQTHIGVDYNFPSEYKAVCESDFITVNIDADVVIPETEAYPVYRMIKSRLDRDTVYKIKEYFIGDETLNEFLSVYNINTPDSQRTKSVVKSDLTGAQKTLEAYLDETSAEYKDAFGKGGKELIEERIQILQNSIRDYLEEYKTAPEDKDLIEIKDLWQEISVKETGRSEKYHGFEGATEDGAWEMFVMSRDSGGAYREQVRVCDHSINGKMPSDYPGDLYDVKDAKYTAQEARELAESILADLGIDNYGLLRGCTTETQYTLDTYKNYSTEKSVVSPATFYEFVFTPKLPGDNNLLLRTYVTTMTEAAEKTGTYMPLWETPTIHIIIEANHGLYFYMQDGQFTFDKCLNENVKLLDFDAIKDVIERYIALSPMIERVIVEEDDPQLTHRNVYIDKVELCYIKRYEKDSTDTGITVPVWMLYGTYSDEFEDGTVKQNEHGEEFKDLSPIFCVNAIDGSVIDLSVEG